VQPNAVLRPTSSTQREPLASRSARMRPISATTSSGVLRRFARLCAWLADSGSSIRSARESSAACAPFRFGTSTEVTSPGSARAASTSAAVSASCGSRPRRHERADLDLAQAGGMGAAQPFDLVGGRQRAGDALQAVAQADLAHDDGSVCVHGPTL
jgi:hypothetical protein